MRRANSRKTPEAVDRAPPTGSQPLITTHTHGTEKTVVRRPTGGVRSPARKRSGEIRDGK